MHVAQQSNISQLQQKSIERIGGIQRQIDQISSLLSTIEVNERPPQGLSPESEAVVTATAHEVMRITGVLTDARSVMQPTYTRLHELEMKVKSLEAQLAEAEGRAKSAPPCVCPPVKCPDYTKEIYGYIENIDLPAEVLTIVADTYRSVARELLQNEGDSLLADWAGRHLSHPTGGEGPESRPIEYDHEREGTNTAEGLASPDGPGAVEEGARELGGCMDVSQVQQVAALLWARESSRCTQECQEEVDGLKKLHQEALAEAVRTAQDLCEGSPEPVPPIAPVDCAAASGRPDFAQLGAGARVVADLTSQTYSPPSSSPLLSSALASLGLDMGVGGPEEALSSDSSVGHCWAMQVGKRLSVCVVCLKYFLCDVMTRYCCLSICLHEQGGGGYLTIKLQRPLRVSSVSVQHVSRCAPCVTLSLTCTDVLGCRAERRLCVCPA